MEEIRRGRQTPTQSYVLPYKETEGVEALKIYESTGSNRLYTSTADYSTYLHVNLQQILCPIYSIDAIFISVLNSSIIIPAFEL